MHATTIGIALVLAFAAAGLVGAVPAAEEALPVGTASAKPCVMGDSGDCIIPIYCVQEPCPRFP